MKRTKLAGVGSVRQTPIPVTHTAIELFEPPHVLTPYRHGYTEELFSKTSINGPTLEFEIEGGQSSFVDLRQIFLKLAIRFKIGDTTDEGVHAAVVNNILHSLFSNCEVSLNGIVVWTANNLYGHKTIIETELSHPRECKDTWLWTQGYEYENTPTQLKLLHIESYS